mmetsp:Transcript_8291/g.20952  ORF Transcript_8291/g.20952 Transcript_8291/m.20952 type:complete len:248 (+) Transcript_8291:1695-2438(+)
MKPCRCTAQGATPVVVSGGWPPGPRVPALDGPLGGFQSPMRNFNEATFGPRAAAACLPVAGLASSSSSSAGGAGSGISKAGTCPPGPQIDSAALSKAGGLLCSNFSSTRDVMRLTVGFQKSSPSLSSEGKRRGTITSEAPRHSSTKWSSFQSCSTAWMGCAFCEASNRVKCFRSFGKACWKTVESTYLHNRPISKINNTSFGVLDSLAWGKCTQTTSKHRNANDGCFSRNSSKQRRSSLWYVARSGV